MADTRRRGPGHENANPERQSLFDRGGPWKPGTTDGPGGRDSEDGRGGAARPPGAPGDLGFDPRMDASAQRRQALRARRDVPRPESSVVGTGGGRRTGGRATQ